MPPTRNPPAPWMRDVPPALWTDVATARRLAVQEGRSPPEPTDRRGVEEPGPVYIVTHE